MVAGRERAADEASTRAHARGCARDSVRWRGKTPTTDNMIAQVIPWFIAQLPSNVRTRSTTSYITSQLLENVAGVFSEIFPDFGSVFGWKPRVVPVPISAGYSSMMT